MVFAMYQKSLRRVPIEEIGVDNPAETQMFHKRLETETRNEVRRDLDMFDDKFMSGGDATTGCSGTTLKSNTSISFTSMKMSDVERHRGSGEQTGTSQTVVTPYNGSTGVTSDTGSTGLTSDTGSTGVISDTGSVHTLAVPVGSFQFQADWKTLKNRPEEFYAYFKVTTILVIF